ncbi:hypothetical protein ACFO9Q_04815 [Paenibacillus sp. GCM10023252]|uniref:hypothetical protein n=1 Tax=Paenibacillus sp. GCM10023252 TaxID=3252649 RepID=UPI00360E46A1
MALAEGNSARFWRCSGRLRPAESNSARFWRYSGRMASAESNSARFWRCSGQMAPTESNSARFSSCSRLLQLEEVASWEAVASECEAAALRVGSIGAIAS